jgi:nucleotide-binding universal stress UspA family protein
VPDGILVYLQGAKQSEYVLSPVAALARSLGEAVHLLYVVDSPIPVPVRVSPAQYRSPGLTDACSYAQYLRDWLMEQGVCSDFTLAVGRPAECVAKLGAERFRLLAMSLPSPWRPGRPHGGGGPEALLKHASVPTLVYYPLPGSGTPLPWLTGLIAPLDGSTPAEQALPWVESLARGLRLPVTVTRVVPEYEPPLLPYLEDTASRPGELETEAALYLGRTVVELRERGIGAAPAMLVGDPGTEVATLAREHPGSLVVMATSNPGGPGPWFLASVAQSVIYTSGSAVLLAPAATNR